MAELVPFRAKLPGASIESVDLIRISTPVREVATELQVRQAFVTVRD
jgi:hypothetical protein